MEDLQMLIRMKGLKIWKLAETIGIAEITLYRWLRTYNKEHRDKILSAIEKLEGSENS